MDLKLSDIRARKVEGAQNMGTSKALYLKILLFFPIALEVQSKFINFKPGYEYVYSFEGHSTVKDLGKFVVKAKVRIKCCSYFKSAFTMGFFMICFVVDVPS